MPAPRGLVVGRAIAARPLSTQPSGWRPHLPVPDSSATCLPYRSVATESSSGISSTGIQLPDQLTAQDSKDSSLSAQDGARDPPRVRLHVEDIFPDSLQETLEAHKRRTKENEEVVRHCVHQPPIRYVTSNNTAGSKALHVRSRTQSKAPRIWSSFKDFRAQHQVSDAELLERLGPLSGSGTKQAPSEDKSASHQLKNDGVEGARPEDTRRKSTNVPSTPESPSRVLRDYTVGIPQDVQAPWKSSNRLPSSILWMQEKISCDTDDQILTASIAAFDDFMTLDESDKKALKQLVDPTVKLAEETLPETEIVLHGSHATGLTSVLSDVDLNIRQKEYPGISADSPDAKGSTKLDRPLRKLRAAIRKIGQENGEYSLIQIVAMRYPLLRYNRGGFEIQISSGRETSATTQTVLSLLDEYPTIRPIYQVLHYALSIRKLSNAAEGGVGSYTLLVMIVTALKHSKQVTLYDSLGQQLLAVLDFWGKADVDTLGFAATPPITFPKFGTEMESEDESSSTDSLAIPLYRKSQLKSPEGRRAYIADTIPATKIIHEPVQAGIVFLQDRNRFFRRSARGHRHYSRGPWQLSLQDPADPTNDLGIAAYRIHDVLATLRVLHEQVVGKLRLWQESASGMEGLKSPRDNPIGPLVASDTSAVLMRRRMFRNMAAKKRLVAAKGEIGIEAPSDPPHLPGSFYETFTPRVRGFQQQNRDHPYSVFDGDHTDRTPGREPPTGTVPWRSREHTGMKPKERVFRRVLFE